MKVLLLANTDWYLYNFRRALAHHLQQSGYDVTLICPNGPYVDKLRGLGFKCTPFDFPVGRLSLFKEFRFIFRLIMLYQREKPRIVHHFTIRCVLYGSIAARIVHGISVVNALTGMGHVFTADSMRAKLLRPVVRFLYRFFLTGSRGRTIFQNSDDMHMFVKNGIVDGSRCHVILGSGVNCTIFKRRKRRNGTTEKQVTVLFASRLIREKGVDEFIKAASLVRSQGMPVKFLLAGDIYEQNPSSLTQSDLESICRDGVVNLLGHIDDMQAILEDTDIVVLPSYREGCPRILIEAGAMEIPIVTTDVPGCNAVVEHGLNGYLVPPRNILALAEAISQLACDGALRQRFGKAGRRVVQSRFGESTVLENTTRVYRQLVGRTQVEAKDLRVRTTH
jgi:glycosyltransferase involved in cell wall biosynthesis